MISTMDSISGGRMELGIGAGWKRDEWLAYGYGFPETKERLARLGDDLEVITRDARRRQARARDVRGPLRAASATPINVPKPIQQPRVPIMVGGNGPERDLAPGRPARRRAQPRRHDAGRGRRGAARDPGRCEEIGRDPATLPVSVHVWGETSPRPARPGSIGSPATASSGVSRVMGLVRASATSDEALESLVEDARAAGVEIG